jgi:uncharacterized protein YggE
MQHKVLALAAMVCLLGACIAGLATAAEETKDRVITASGTGEVLIAPDEAMVTLGVLTENADVKVAQAENAQKMAAVVAAIGSLGIAKEDIRTTGYSIDLVYEDTGSAFSRKVKLYRVSNMVMVTVRNVTRAGDVVDTGVQAGANQVRSVTFTLSDATEQSARSQALQIAVANSRRDADTVAGPLGVNITGVKDATISGYYPAPVRYDTSYGAASKDMAATPIEAGMLTVTASVTVNYLIS